ncbi:hypothetical protein [Allokutzneria oryzae]|uniref:AAA+ ATPase domain-containing protein n=1 Tax=Allokutzneria oryzae TaxID=1378989 RepID=A0ABV6A7N1_9PSEU
MPAEHGSGRTHNDLSGQVMGNLVQAGTINRLVLTTPAEPVADAWGVPARQRFFVNRTEERAWLLDRLRAPHPEAPLLLLLSALPGTGKTALVAECASELEDDFDKIFYADLNDYRHDGAVAYQDILGEFIRGLGIGRDWVAEGLPARKHQFRTESRQVRVLVVLDNVDRHDDITALIPSSAASAVLVVSHWQLDHVLSQSAEDLRLSPLDGDHAMALMGALCPRERLDAEPDAVAELIARCGRLPLLLHAVAARLRKRPAREIADLVRDLDGGNLVVDLFDVPFGQLGPDAQRLYGLLGVSPGATFTEDMAATVLGVSREAVRAVVDELLDASLLTEDRGGRVRFLGPVREHAARVGQRLGGDVREQAQHRLARWMAVLAALADRAVKRDRLRIVTIESVVSFASDVDNPFSSAAKALDWLESERSALAEIAATALRYGWFDLVVMIAEAMFALHMNRPHPLEWQELDRIGLAAAKRWGNGEAEARMLSQRARFELDNGDSAAALATMAAARELAESTDNLRLVGSVFELTGRLLFERRQDAEATRAYERFLEIGERIGPGPQAIAKHYLGRLAARAGRTEEAVRLLRDALAFARRQEDARTEARVMVTLSEVDGDAEEWLRRAVEIFRARDMPTYEADALERLVALAEARGDRVVAKGHLERLLGVYERSRHPGVAALRDRVARY